jgi:hypothetical protein
MLKDTTYAMEALFHELMMKKSGQERMKMGFSMFNTARSQVMASIIMNNPDIDIKEIKKEIFLRFYRMEFDPEEQKKILMQIMQAK